MQLLLIARLFRLNLKAINMRIFYTTTVLCLVILGLMPSCQQNSNIRESQLSDKEKTDQLVVKQMESFDAPGLAVGLMKNGEIVYADAHGVQGLDTQAPLTTKSLFHMASVSKPFVATGIVQLMEQGKLQLSDKLTDHLPYFKMADPRYTDITLNHMLTHTSGIPDVEDYEWDKPQYDEGAAERYARSFETVMLDFAPGSAYNYSNAAFDILCAVIAKISGMTFENYMKVHIFEPVGMVHSTFYKPEVAEEIATKPHVRGDSLDLVVSKVYPYNRRHAGSSTLHSNVEDMMLWAEVNLNKGAINGNRIYQESSYDLLTTTQKQIGERSIGLSWFLSKLNDKKVIFHQGGDTGYSTFFAFIPEKKSAIALMTNMDDFWSNSAAVTIVTRVIFDSVASWKAPIHYKLKDYILSEGMDKTREVYFHEKAQSPQTYLFNGNFLDELGYWLLDRGYAEKALGIFLLNVELEPEDAGWVDSVADAYVAMDSTASAIKWYQKALEMDPEQDFSREKLNKLMGK